MPTLHREFLPPPRCQWPEGVDLMTWSISETGWPQYSPARSGYVKREEAPRCLDTSCEVCYTDTPGQM